MDQKKKCPSKIGLSIVCILMAVLVAANVAGGIYANVITQFFSPALVDDEAVAEISPVAEDVVEKVASEGIVLLKNDNALPLDQNNSKEMHVNLFGWASLEPIISGGIGSGSGNTANALDYVSAMEACGFTVNHSLLDFYDSLGYTRANGDNIGLSATSYEKVEAPIDAYSDELWSEAKDFSNVAIINYGRVGNEYGDVPIPEDMPTNSTPPMSVAYNGEPGEHYLELGKNERDLLTKVSSMGFDKVIVLVNGGFPMELGITDELGVDAVLWIGAPGQTGMKAVANVLKGEVNPSGRLVDTFPYDLTSAPSCENFGTFSYTGLSDFSYGPYNYFLNYSEGIYVGYRYYETRYVDNETGLVNETSYSDVVQYPFGYGLSYTEFEQEITSFKQNDKSVEISVKVKNVGDTAGKDVVQIYNTAPYTIGGIEKSHVVLVDFGKTEILEPGKSETLTFEIALEDLASFDYQCKGCYVLEGGTYELKVMKNAHEVIDSRTFDVANTIVYDKDNKRSSDEIAATARFEDAQGDITYLSRADWEGTWPHTEHEVAPSEEIVAAASNFDPDPNLVYADAEDIIVKDNGLKLNDMIGLDYDDPKWDLLLEQLSVDEMQKLIPITSSAARCRPVTSWRR